MTEKRKHFPTTLLLSFFFHNFSLLHIPAYVMIFFPCHDVMVINSPGFIINNLVSRGRGPKNLSIYFKESGAGRYEVANKQ